ncbi:hypothetical protein P1P75_34825 [Streptomyces sp. ID05-39B]|uniref:hypothetical protein n=1 Tax=Streptomyces sp. ID05-39B TaxID=3028664 RepID=UPI0029AE79E7|nr:hypothetical protein [Streptomyces sp. ID05-39B]MDX3531434.1 hypothetical protein [Streptomyces sp. ID05-39B]
MARQRVLRVGNADELGRQFGEYAKAGLEHTVLANTTGLIGGVGEIRARARDLPTLKAVLSDL